MSKPNSSARRAIRVWSAPVTANSHGCVSASSSIACGMANIIFIRPVSARVVPVARVVGYPNSPSTDAKMTFAEPDA